MCKEVEAVLKEETNKPMLCEVTMDGVKTASDDFVAILAKPNGDAAFFYNTDALTLGLAMKMVAKAFVDSMANLSEEEQAMVNNVLTPDFAKGATEDE